MTPVSGRRNRRMMSCSTRTSASLSAAVGSSMIRIRASYDSALAISTICCLATVSPPTTWVGCNGRCSRSMSSWARAFEGPLAQQETRRSGAPGR